MKSQKELQDFTRFCTKHPDLRFWQALLVWTKKNKPEVSEVALVTKEDLDIKVVDTFFM